MLGFFTALECTVLSITGCAVAQHCCNDTQQSQWENGDWTPVYLKPPENFITKIGHIDYVAGGNTHAKFYGNWPRGVRPTNSQNITSCDFVYLPFPFHFFLVIAYSNKKAVLPQGNRAMLQVFFSVEVRQQHSLQV